MKQNVAGAPMQEYLRCALRFGFLLAEMARCFPLSSPPHLFPWNAQSAAVKKRATAHGGRGFEFSTIAGIYPITVSRLTPNDLYTNAVKANEKLVSQSLPSLDETAKCKRR